MSYCLVKRGPAVIRLFHSLLAQAIWAVQGDCQSSLKNGGNSHRSHEPTAYCHIPLQWHHNERDDISNHRRLDGLLNRLFKPDQRKHQSSVSLAICEGNSPVTGEFPSQRASYAESVSIWWYHHANILKPTIHKGWYQPTGGHAAHWQVFCQ